MGAGGAGGRAGMDEKLFFRDEGRALRVTGAAAAGAELVDAIWPTGVGETRIRIGVGAALMATSFLQSSRVLSNVAFSAIIS